jgi:hypothetical protein
LPRAKSLNKKSTSTSVPLNRQRKWPTSTSGHRLHSVAAGQRQLFLSLATIIICQ